jgi:hypothetical protein
MEEIEFTATCDESILSDGLSSGVCEAVEVSHDRACDNAPTSKEIKMDAQIQSTKIIERDVRRDNDVCLDVGLEGMASSQRIGLDAGSRAERIGLAELGAIDRVGGDVCDSSRDIMRDIHSAGNHVSATVERTSDRTQAGVERFGLSELEAVRDSERYLFAGMSANAREILLKSCADTSSIKDQSALQFKDLLLQSAANAKDAVIAACDLKHQAAQNTAAIQLEAFRHKEELARQIAECCCEQKALTLEASHATQALIRESDKERLRDERDKLREELIALRVRATLPPPLVGGLSAI